jgi:GGDEF domain-containing protein
MVILSLSLFNMIAAEMNKPISIQGSGNYTSDQIKNAVAVMNIEKNNTIWYKAVIITVIILAVSVSLMYFLLVWLAGRYQKSVFKNHPISSVTESLPIYMCLKKDGSMKISHSQGTMLKTLGISEQDVIGRHPKDILPSHLIENIGFAWEDAFEGISTNYISHINGKAYNIIVKPVHGESEFDPRPVTEVISLAIDVSNASDDINDPSKIRLSREMIMMKRIEKALQQANKYDHLAAVIIIQIQGMDILAASFNKDQLYDLVAKIADRVSGNLRGGDNMIHTPEGRFVILLSHVKKKEFASYILQDIIKSVCQSIFLDGYEVSVPAENKMILFPNELNAKLEDIENMLIGAIG